MKFPPGMSAEQYISLVKAVMPDFDRVACAETEDDFCEAVGRAVRYCLQKLEDRRKWLSNANEVALSTDLADLLSMGGLPTSAESNVNGHVDLVIKHFEAGKYRVLGECKLDRGPKHHCDGAAQVLGYCSGAEKQALCISFCKLPDVLGRMLEARKHFAELGDCHEVDETRDHDLPWSFLGIHHHSSGETIEILHLGCNLHEPGASAAGTKKDSE